MKRKIKRQLKEDELVTGFQKFFEFFEAWQKEIIIFAVVVAAIAALFGAFQIIKSQQAKKQSLQAGEILALRADLTKNPQNVAKLEQIGARGNAGRLAFISLGSYWIEQGDLDKARAALARIQDNPKDFYYYQARDLAAQIDVLKGNYDLAIQGFKRIEDAKPKDYILDAVLYHHAEALEKKGSVKEARDFYKKVQDEYAQTYYGYDAAAKVKKLESVK